jgi:hypothetical protein
MPINNKPSLFFLLLFVLYGTSNAHETKKLSLECTGKVTKERQPLFIKAEKQEQNFLNVQTQCLQANDCDINPAYKNAKDSILCSISALVAHLEELEKGKNGACTVCEKNETKEIKRRLTELLKSAQ